MHESMHDVSHLISILAASIPVRRACLLSNEAHYCVCDECAIATCRTLFQNVTVSRSSSKHVSAWFSRALFLQKPAKQLGFRWWKRCLCDCLPSDEAMHKAHCLPKPRRSCFYSNTDLLDLPGFVRQ